MLCMHRSNLRLPDEHVLTAPLPPAIIVYFDRNEKERYQSWKF